MKIMMIDEMLQQLNVVVEELILGDYDAIGEYTAKKFRQPNDSMYRHGCTFRPNYERGILLTALINYYNCEAVLEIGFGRGYGAICAAKALESLDAAGKVTTIDVKFDRDHLKLLGQLFPPSILNRINCVEQNSHAALEQIHQLGSTFDLTYIDGDHTYEGTKGDWERAKIMTNKVVVFDDYHLPGKVEKDIECARLIDEIDWGAEGYHEPILVKMDRRIFHDDRKISDEDLNYGQVVAVKK